MDIEKIRKDFPFFSSKLNKDIVYLDSAATTQKPKAVIDSIEDYYINNNANANRGAYSIAVRSTELLEGARKKVSEFIGAKNKDSIIFTKSTTESINLIAYAYGLKFLKPGDEVLISVAEHHANLVSWQFITNLTGARLKYFYLDENLNFDLNDYESKLNENTKIVAFTAASNVLSFDVPIKEMIKKAKSFGAITLVDGAQYIAHHKADVIDWGCDFFVFSGHKMYAQNGVGVLYGRPEILEKMNPFMLGGDMIEYVQEQSVSFAPVPHKFEAGTLDIGAINSLKIAIEYIESVGIDKISEYEEELTRYCVDELKKLDYINLYYPKKNQSGTNVSFTFEGVHPHDVSQILDFENIAIRTGHHCTQVLHRYLGLNSTCRVSIAFYNTKDDIDRLVKGLKKVKEVFYGN